MLAAGLCALAGVRPALAEDGPGKPAPTAAAPAKAAATPAAEKVVMRYKAAAGQTKRTGGKAALTFNGNGALKIEIKQTSKVTYTRVDEKSGELTFEDVTESQEFTFPDGRTQKSDKADTSSATIRPNGTLVSYKSSDPSDKDGATLDTRLFVATTIVYPDTPVGVGDKWGHDYKADTTLGTRDAHADFEVVGVTQIGGNDALKIKMAYAEKGEKAVTTKGTFLVEKITGDEIASDYTLDNVPFPNMGMARGALQSQRLEGGPLVASKNDTKAVQVAMAGEASEAKKDRTIDEVVKDGFEKLPGIVTLYRKKDSGREQIYVELREDQLNKLMLLQTTASTGTADQVIAGDPIDDLLFKFVKLQDDRVVLTVPNWYYRADAGTPMGKAVRRSFADALIQSFRVEAKQADRKSLLIDVSDLFKSDIARISEAFQSTNPFGMPSGGGFSIDREKTYIDSVKNFPENLIVRTQYNFMRGGRGGSDTLADSRGATVAISYNLSALPVDENYQPTNGYRPRLADPRVGYFNTEFVDFADDSREDLTRRFILRWDVRKKDPTAAVSEPVKPIVFWLDNAIPTEYREAVGSGILTWNKAFLKIGIKDAIQVKQMPDNADWDHADLRYNVIRWVVTPDDAPRNGVAIALFRQNPITGQILNASISVDASWTRYGKLQRRNIIEPATAFAKGAGMETDALIAELAKNPAGIAGFAPLQMERLMGGDPRFCEAGGNEKREQAWTGAFALDMLGLLDPAASVAGGGGAAAAASAREKEYTTELIKETVAHEMGHILGLRHNFLASTAYTLDQLKDPKRTAEQGVSASLMDYNAFNVSALRTKGVPYFQTTVGVYDLWAIQYGYTDVPDAKTTDEEQPALKRIASLSSKPGHAYQNDSLRIAGWDPNVSTYDLSADPLAYYGRMLDLSRYLLVNLDKRLPKTGDSYWEFTKAYSSLLGRYAQAAGASSRYIGGLNASRNHKGDPGGKPALVPIDGQKQKQALALVNKYIFSPTALSFPERYYTYLTPDPNTSSVMSMMRADYPVLDQISGIQKTALQKLFSGTVLSRVANNEFKRGGDPAKVLTLPTLFGSIGNNVWADLGNKKLPTLRRQLQRTWLDTMADMALKPGGAPEDARMLAWDQLRQLRPRLVAAQNAGGYDAYTRIHLADSLTKIDRTLRADVTIGGGGSAGGPNLLQMLMGGAEQKK
jgi:hypothetical protein